MIEECQQICVAPFGEFWPSSAKPRRIHSPQCQCKSLRSNILQGGVTVLLLISRFRNAPIFPDGSCHLQAVAAHTRSSGVLSLSPNGNSAVWLQTANCP